MGCKNHNTKYCKDDSIILRHKIICILHQQFSLQHSVSLEPLVNEIKNNICESKTAYFDETKYPINGKTGWIWTGTNGTSCFITVEKSRGKNVLQKYFSSFVGVAICDGWAPYRIFNIRQRCWAHILREAKYYSEKLDTENSASLYHSLQELFWYPTTNKIKNLIIFCITRLFNHWRELFYNMMTINH